MKRFWDIIIEPILETTTGKILEIGAWKGENTINLLNHCKENKKTLEVIDPLPLFSKEEIQEEHGYDFILHESLSLKALPTITDIDTGLIDGDHNWFTVFNELNLIYKNHANADDFPIVLFHDVEWPYARRDLYYDPETIPTEHQQPYRKAGLVPGSTKSQSDYHFNSHLYNANEEGGAKNGVLTAVEDFIQESSIEWVFEKVPFFHGLGILVSKKRLANNKKFTAFIEKLNTLEFYKEMLVDFEETRAKEFADIYHEKEIVQKELNFQKWKMNSLFDKDKDSKSIANLLKRSPKKITDDFTKLYYDSWVWFGETKWLGSVAKKSPLDMWVYQEIIFDLKPDLIIETGTYDGGSTAFLASILDLVDNGEVISIDIKIRADVPKHPRIKYIEGSSVSESLIKALTEQTKEKRNVLVILDSDHSKEHVLNELQCYSPLVPIGSYLIVEDTIINGNPVLPKFGPGPMEAVKAFVAENNDFEIDTSKEKFFMTFNKQGFLKRIN